MVLIFARDWGRAKTVCLRAKAMLDKRVVNDVKLPHSRAPEARLVDLYFSGKMGRENRARDWFCGKIWI